MYAVNGPSSSNGKPVPAQGFIIDMKGSGEIVSIFGSKASTHVGTVKHLMQLPLVLMDLPSTLLIYPLIEFSNLYARVRKYLLQEFIC